MKHLPTIHTESQEPFWLPTDEILYINVNGRIIEFFTFNGTYRNPRTMTELHSLIWSEGFEFADRKSTLTNLQNVTNFDKKTRTASFVHESGKTMKVEVSRRLSKIFRSK